MLQFGVRRFVRSVEKKMVKVLQEQVGVSSPLELQRLMEGGLLQFLSDRCPVNLLRSLSQQLGLDALPRSELQEATEREHQLADEIMLGGVEALLFALPPALLRVLCKELALDVAPAATEELADAIMTHLFDLQPLPQRKLEAKRRHREAEEPEADRPSRREGRSEGGRSEGGRSASASSKAARERVRGKSRYKAPPLSNIKRGITKQELHDLYNFTDLQEFCRSQGLDYTGKKAVLIRRIVTFLDTGDKGAQKPRKRKHYQ